MDLWTYFWKWSDGPIFGKKKKKKKKKKKLNFFFPSNFVLSKFERTEFERTINLGLYSKERIFSFETNFERTTDKF